MSNWLMFKCITRRWYEARGGVLRDRFEDVMTRLEMLDQQVNMICALTLSSAYRALDRRCGPISNISNNARKSLAKRVMKEAKADMALCRGRGYGLYLLGALLEAETLPGEDAAFVRQNLEMMLQIASQVSEYVKGACASRYEERDILVQSMIRIARSLGATTAREAAEVAQGRPLTDNEWIERSDMWERNWTAIY